MGIDEFAVKSNKDIIVPTKYHKKTNFKKILVKNDGSTWYLTDSEVELWEKDGSITTGDVLYKVVEDTLY